MVVVVTVTVVVTGGHGGGGDYGGGGDGSGDDGGEGDGDGGSGGGDKMGRYGENGYWKDMIGTTKCHSEQQLHYTGCFQSRGPEYNYFSFFFSGATAVLLLGSL